MLQPAILFGLRVGWLVAAWCEFCAGGIFEQIVVLQYFLMFLTLLFTTFYQLQVTSFRT